VTNYFTLPSIVCGRARWERDNIIDNRRHSHFFPAKKASISRENSGDFPFHQIEGRKRKIRGKEKRVWSGLIIMDESFTPPPPMSSSQHNHVKRMLDSNRFKSPSKTIYSDRFIPSRSASNFALFNLTPSTEDGCSCSPYGSALRSALFGPSTPNKFESPNIFRFKSETRQSMHSLSLTPFTSQDVLLPGYDYNHKPLKRPRKIPPSSFKVFFFFLSVPVLRGFVLRCLV